MARVWRYCGGVLSLCCILGSTWRMESSWSHGGGAAVAVYALFVLSNFVYAQILIAEGRARERERARS